ncbi:MAG: TlpA disulfide reductase family protein, partial [Rhodospirillaceae bacterium]|nr:TlpA disulfide reductase family protein [Rhodospirillaceae bacterium]
MTETTRRNAAAMVALAVTGAAGGLSHTVAAAAAQVKPGPWRAVIDTPIGELPFNLDLAQTNGAWVATLINGPERVDAEITTVDGATLAFEFPSYGSRIEGTVGADGVMTGTIALKRSSGPYVVPFTARHGLTHRFVADGAPSSGDVGGRWAVTVTAASGTATSGIGEWAQAGRLVDGAVIYVNADTRFLHGELNGAELALSTFDGGTGSLWKATLQPDGTLAGQSFSMVGSSVSTWRAVKDPTVALPDPHTLTYLKPGYDRFDFKFPDLDGKPVSLSDDRFKGKVVIVTIAGSWCPTCHDEARFMAPLVKENRARGLEAVALQYEYSPEFDKAVAACRAFARRYGIDYPMLIAGTADKAAASKTLPMINAVLVYPTMIVVDRTGAVRRIHTSFP